MNVLSIGTFDGVHRGHQALLAYGKRLAKKQGVPYGVLTFYPNPYYLWDKTPVDLMNLDQKIHYLTESGADFVRVIPFDYSIVKQSPDEFINSTLKPYKPSHIVVGINFRFGFKQLGDPNTLKKMAHITAFPLQRYKNIVCSSTRIRSDLRLGNLDRANALLTRYFEIEGVLIPGRKMGARIGFPTLNLSTGMYVAPKSGTYITKIHTTSGKVYHGVANIGYSPTFVNRPFLLEIHVLNWEEDPQLTYGKTISVQCIHFVRAEKKFSSIETLQKAIANDVKKTKEWFHLS